MIEILLIRHGETSYNKDGRFMGITDIGLNSEGRRQVRGLKKKLSKVEIDLVLSSDLQRCRETAGLIFDGDIEYHPLLREMNFGRWEGERWTDIKEKDEKEYLRWKKNWIKRPAPGGESFTEMSLRAVSAIDGLLKREFTRAAVVTHGGCIRSILGHYIIGSLKNSWRFQVDNGAVTRLCFNDAYGYLRTLNEK